MMQVELLGLLVLQPDRAWSLDELSQTVGASKSSVHRELQRALDAGLLNRDDAQRPHRYGAAQDSPTFPPIRDLLERTVGVAKRLRAELSEIDGVEAAVIHGSWAAGRVSATSDIDIFAVVNDDERDARRAIRRVCRRAGREADIAIASSSSAAEMGRMRTPFWLKLINGPRVDLVGDLTSIAP
jgi:predicted nucleotidyltransferase